MTAQKTRLKIDHTYRVAGPALRYGRSYQKELFEALRYAGPMVPFRNGSPDLKRQIEVFYSFSRGHYVLFEQDSFEAEELLA